jgi:hypothetical protein
MLWRIICANKLLKNFLSSQIKIFLPENGREEHQMLYPFTLISYSISLRSYHVLKA